MKHSDPDANEYKSFKGRKDEINKIIKQLQTNKNIKDICNDAIPPYIEDNDIEFEKNPNVFCFRDKVFDLIECKFIDVPDKYDYMVITTGYDYREPLKEEMDKINELLTKVFLIPEERKLYLTILATGLYGKTLEKFTLANGSGRNGKGFINELVAKTLGNYAYTCSNAVLLNSIKDGANQTIANMDNKRVIFYREPDTSNLQKINSSTVKEISGGNEINARGLYSSKTKTLLKATHILECNERPKISGETDDAIAMRLIDIGFRSTFTKNKNDVDTDNNIYEGDDTVKDIAFQDNHKFALFHILVEHWKNTY